MRVLLISPERNYPMANEMYPSGALLLLGTLLKQAGHEVKVIHQVADKEPTEYLGLHLVAFRPDIVGITMSTYQTKETRRIAEKVKIFSPKILVVVGGSHPSALKEKVLTDYPDVDIAVYGEGENALTAIANGGPLESIAGIIYRKGGRGCGGDIITNPPSPLLSNLDALPVPDLTLVDMKNFSGVFPVGRRPSMYMMASRGCPYQCRFCSKSIYGNTVRFHSVPRILNEINYLRNYGFKEIFFQDDTFNANREWTEDLLNSIIRYGYNKDMIFRAPLRVNKNLVDIELLRLMKRAGFWLIFYGVENGNQEMLNRMKKGITVEEVERAFQLTHYAGIKTEASFIIGLPGETSRTIDDSIDLWKRIKPYWSGFSRATPFPGTLFYEEVKAGNYLHCFDFEEYAPSKTMVETDDLSVNALETVAQATDRMLYKDKLRRPKQVWYGAIDKFRRATNV